MSCSAPPFLGSRLLAGAVVPLILLLSYVLCLALSCIAYRLLSRNLSSYVAQLYDRITVKARELERSVAHGY